MSRKLVVGVVMLLLMLTGAISVPGCVKTRSYQINGCPVIVAYTDDTNGGYALNVYVAATGVHRTVISRKLQGFASIICYDKKSDCWFIEEDKVVSKRTVKICGKKATSVKLAESPLGQPGFKSRVTPDGKLLISFYNNGGKLASERELSIQDALIVDCSSISWSPANGCIATELLLKNATESQLFLFDDNSHLTASLGRGSDPQFVAGGRRLIYQDMSWVRSSNEELEPSKLGTGNAVIYDIPAHTKRVVDIAHSPNAVLGGVADCIGSSDGNWLVCSYARYPEAGRRVYIVDIRNKNAKWHRLPISVYGRRLILLDTMPKRFSVDSGKRFPNNK